MPITSSSVRLYGHSSSTASGWTSALLHPETELSNVVCTSGGLLTISGNDISVPINSIGIVVESSGFIKEPLIESAGGATVTNIGESTGYGTSLITIRTTPTVRTPATSASNDYIPTEQAVAVGLDGKQDALDPMAGITITPEGNGRSLIQVNAVNSVGYGSDASTSAFPTEYAVRGAINVDVTTLSASVASTYATQVWAMSTFVQKGEPTSSGGGDVPYAQYDTAGKVMPISGMGLVIGGQGSLTVQSAGVYNTYASAAAQPHGAVRVLNSITSTGDVTYQIAGYVPHVNAVYNYVSSQLGGCEKPLTFQSGLSRNNNVVTLLAATTTSRGGITVPTTGGLTISGDAISLQSAGYVTASNGVQSGTAVIPLGGVRVLSNGGITLTSGNLYLQNAGSSQIGGVTVPNSSGLAIANGAITASMAHVYAGGYSDTGATAGSGLGAVKVLGTITSNSTYAASAYVPNVQAVWAHVSTALAEHAPAAAGYATTISTTIPALGGVRIFSNGGIGITTTGASAGNIYLTGATVAADGYIANQYVSNHHLGGVVLRSDFVGAYLDDTSKPFAPTRRAVYNALRDAAISFTAYSGSDKKTYNIGPGDILDGDALVLHIDASAVYTSIGASQDIVVYLHITREDSTSPWTIPTGYLVFTTEPGTDTDTDRYFPIARYTTDASGEVTAINQIQYGNINLQEQSGAGGKPVSSGAGITVTDNTTSYTISLNSATTSSLGGVVVGSGINVNNGTISLVSATSSALGGVVVGSGINITDGTISVAGGAVVAAYTGPFAVSQVTSTTNTITANVSGGYVKWLDGDSWVNSSYAALGMYTLSKATSTTAGWVGNNSALYLTGSSGFVEGATITDATFIISGGNQGYTYEGTLESGRELWYNSSDESISCWLNSGAIPYNGTVMYAQATGDTSVGTISASLNTIVVNGVTYTQESLTPTAAGYAWANGAAKVYTSKALPGYYTKTMPMISSGFSFTVTDPDFPPAGRFYTKLAENQNGALVQQQYGTVWHEHWGDDYKGQFAIGRITINQTTADTAATGSYPYRYIVNGGTVYGGIDFNTGGIIDGVVADGGVVLSPAALQYPKNTEVLAAGRDDGLFFPYNPYANYPVWLNIWKGPWTSEYSGKDTDTRDIWRFVIDSQCLEGQIDNAYSINIGWITGNGAPQQDYKGAISIRGRWA